MTSFVSAVVQEWAKLAAPLVERGFKFSTNQSAELGKAVIELKGSDRVALVEVWEHAHCLDTTVHHTSSQHGSILAAGPCQTLDEAVARLVALQVALLAPANGYGAA